MLFVLSLPVKCDGTVPASVFLHPCPTSREKPACRQSHSQGKEMRPRMHDKPKRTAAQVRGQGMHKRMRACTTPVRRRTQHERPGTFRAAKPRTRFDARMGRILAPHSSHCDVRRTGKADKIHSSSRQDAGALRHPKAGKILSGETPDQKQRERKERRPRLRTAGRQKG